MKFADKWTMLLVIGDLVLAIVAVYAGYALRFGTLPAGDGAFLETLQQAMLFAAGALFASYFLELYDREKTRGLKELLLRAVLGAVLSFAALSVLYYAVPAFKIGRGFFLISLAAFCTLQFLWRLAFRALANSEGLARKVLVLGTGMVAQKIGALIRATNHQHVLRGYFSCDQETSAVPPQDIVGRGCLADVVRREKPQKIVVSLTERRGALPVQEILSCKLSGIEVIDSTSFYEEMTGKLLLEDLRPSWIIFSDGFRVTRSVRVYKRAFDVLAAVTGLLLTLPVLPFIALAIVLDSGRPVLFRQSRAGQDDAPFRLSSSGRCARTRSRARARSGLRRTTSA